MLFGHPAHLGDHPTRHQPEVARIQRQLNGRECGQQSVEGSSKHAATRTPSGSCAGRRLRHILADTNQAEWAQPPADPVNLRRAKQPRPPKPGPGLPPTPSDGRNCEKVRRARSLGPSLRPFRGAPPSYRSYRHLPKQFRGGRPEWRPGLRSYGEQAQGSPLLH